LQSRGEDPAARLVQETDKYEDQWLRDLLERTSIDPSELEIGDSIAEGGQANVYLAKYTVSPRNIFVPNLKWITQLVVVKRYKRRLGVRTVHELRRRIQHLQTHRFYVYVGDYESSDGVVGTGFWRPPEVLKAVKEDTTPTYTTAADVYGFGMVCYELLTGHIPFQCEDVRRTDYDAVLSGRRPRLPDYLSPGMTQLLIKCWHHDPCQRPTWDEIKKTLYTETMILLGPQCRNLPPAVYNISKGHP
jgi:hypothetical protein